MESTKKILCYGDSNTWGACGFSGGRRDKERRWTGIIDTRPGYTVINCGENGREIPHDKWGFQAFETIMAREAPIDLLIIMLGTNDLFNIPAPDADKITARMEEFLNTALKTHAAGGDGSKILLIAPPHTQISRACGNSGYDEISAQLGRSYRDLAGRLGINFADAAAWGVTPGPDGVHFTEEGHRAFARGLERVLNDIFSG